MSDTKRRTGRTRAEEIRQEEASRGRRQTVMIYGVVATAVLALIVAAVIGVRSSGDDGTSQASQGNLASVSGLGSTAVPPWPLPADVRARVKAAGLNMGAMGTAEHYHPHLQVIIDGQQVVVPEGIGIDPRTGAMSAVHTHSSDGVIHVEAGTAGQAFTIGQLFTEWNVRLSGTQIGATKAGDGETLTAFVDGKRVAGDPALIRLSDKQQIALVLGPKETSDVPPPDFTFPDDL